MFATLIQKLTLIFHDEVLRRRIFFTVGLLAFSRLLAAIPVPGIDLNRLEALLSESQFLGLLNLFSGGGISNLSIVLLGVGPYITASIIMQLLTIMSPRLKAMYQEDGEAGRAKFTQYSRLLTVPIALVQGWGFLTLLTRQGVVPSLTPFDFIVNVMVVAAGSIFMMWLGELITEFGLGNGVSLLIFAGIVSQVPSAISQLAFTFEPSQVPIYAAFLLAALAVIVGVVVVTEAERPIPVTYAKRVRGMKIYGGVSTYLPLRLNQAGVIPIIFALSILILPQMLFGFLSTMESELAKTVAEVGTSILSNTWIYSFLYFVLVFLFTYFYTAITFDPNTIATNLQKSGAFIPGIRPGKPTSEHLSHIITRLTLIGALFLGIIAVLPLVMRSLTNINALAIGGTALLIVVSVVLDFVKKIDAQVSMREY